jgi:hypothetical protein
MADVDSRRLVRSFALPRGWLLGLAASLASDGSWEITQRSGIRTQLAMSLHLVHVPGKRPILGFVVGPLALYATVFRDAEL